MAFLALHTLKYLRTHLPTPIFSTTTPRCATEDGPCCWKQPAFPDFLDFEDAIGYMKSQVDLRHHRPKSAVSPATFVWPQLEGSSPSTVVHLLKQFPPALLDIGYFWLWILLSTLQRILWTWMIMFCLHIILQSIYVLWSRMFPPPDPMEDDNNNDDEIPNGFVRQAQFIAL